MSEWSERYRAYLNSDTWREKRAAVLARSNGLCEACGEHPAVEVHHTTYDHVFEEPLWELRAVCRECHQQISEADGLIPPRRQDSRPQSTEVRLTQFKPREWQKRGADECVERLKIGADRALVYACPGAGKTYGALLIAQTLINVCKKTSEIVVVTPNLAIRSQWIERAREMGIVLEEVSDPRELQQGRIHMGAAHGFILGYQQVVRQKHSLRMFCQATQPVVILDEVHHTAGQRADRDGNAWGHAVEYACAHGSFKLPTTGTPFREGNDPIAFVSYNESGEAHATVRYPYADAIRDGVCRQVEFTLFDGYVEWETRGGRTINADFAHKLNNKLARERLDAALSTDGQFPVKMLAAAHEKLMALRSGGGVDAEAGGLVVAINVEHATAIADVLEEMTGERPDIVHNRIDEAQELIQRFRKDGRRKWIVGISMISEGVDIPRLRVGVYATRIRTALYFHQFVGRFARVQENRTERSFVFLPKDPEIEAIAVAIEKETYHALGEDPPERRPRLRTGTGGRDGIEVMASDGDVAANAVGGVLFPTEYIREHAPRISDFRANDPSFASWSDPAILKTLIAARAIEPPRKKAS